MPIMTWNCPAWVNVPLAEDRLSMASVSALDGSFNTKRILVTQCDTAAIFSLPPTYSNSFFESPVNFPTFNTSYESDHETASCLNKLLISGLYLV